MCLKNPSCKYWTWIENHKGWPHTCHLKDANPGLTNLEGVISGDKNCIATPGKGADPNQCHSTFSDKSPIAHKVPLALSMWLFSSCGHVARDFEREAKTRCNFQF